MRGRLGDLPFMKRTSRTLLAAAAVSGLISGAAVEQGHADSTNAISTNAAAGKVAPHKKAPKVHDCAGQNDCKGIGGCKTESHSCKFKNACKGKGGCEMTEKDVKAWEKKQKEEAAKAAVKDSTKDATKDAPKPSSP
jgi:hypothetical protein